MTRLKKAILLLVVQLRDVNVNEKVSQALVNF